VIAIPALSSLDAAKQAHLKRRSACSRCGLSRNRRHRGGARRRPASQASAGGNTGDRRKNKVGTSASNMSEPGFQTKAMNADKP
jgi:hypothetical protein